MGRGGKGKGRGGKKSSAPKKSGSEKYGGKKSSARVDKGGTMYDEADEVLKLHEDGVGMSDEEANDSGQDGYDDEEVMAFDEDDDDKPKKKKKAKAALAEEEDEDEDDAEPQPESKERASTAGWKGRDFYGGDDAGDDTDNDSEEELIMEEAKQLEELRHMRLAGHEDLLGSLVASAGADGREGSVADKKPASHSGTSAALEAAAAGAQFESVFAAQAEKSTVARDLSSLSEGKKRGLMKKEAPEMLPLLEDFKAKLSQLQDLLPLLAPTALSRLPASGRTYLESKASLLLSTLANLSFYLLVRAEGGGVRAHPVVSQLVWLRELTEKLTPLDERLGPQLRKSAKAAQKMPADEDAASTSRSSNSKGSTAPVPKEVEQSARKPRQTLRERLEKLRTSMPNGNGAAQVSARANARKAPATKDLLKVPLKKKAFKETADAPDDLDDVDPTLGFRRSGKPLSEQLTSMQTLFRERAAKEVKPSADANVEARARRAREKFDETPIPGPVEIEPAEADEPDEPDIIKQARKNSKAKKSKKEEAMAQRAAHKAIRQFKPEEGKEVVGRRKTSKRILQNRGLVRQRKAQSGNARVSNRRKYDKMVKRRRGAVQDMREGAADGSKYDGEATGVRTHLKKSLKLG